MLLLVLAAVLRTTAASATDEPALSRLIGDRIAGKPVSCISARFLQAAEIVDRTAIVYRGYGSSLYVQRPQQGADQLRRADMIVSRSPLGSLCRADVVDLADRGTQTRTGYVVLGEFVPYTRPRRR